MKESSRRQYALERRIGVDDNVASAVKRDVSSVLEARNERTSERRTNRR